MSYEPWVRTGLELRLDEYEQLSDAPAVSPGKRTLTASLPPRPPFLRGSIVQRKSVSPASGVEYRGQGDTLPSTDPWLQVAMRPDIHEAPQRPEKSDTDSAGSGGSGGARLPTDVQTKMARAFSTDFSDVRIHQDGQAERLGSLAFTSGTDIHFAAGRYNPNDPQGQELLGHELTHVVQQAQGRVTTPTQAKGMGVNDDTAFEREADEMGRRAARGQRASIGGATPGGSVRRPGVVQAKADPEAGPTAKKLDAIQIDPAHESQVIADWDDGTRVSTVIALRSRTGDGAAHFASEGEAIAQITASGGAGAVFLENGRYVPYAVKTSALIHTFAWDRVRHDKQEPWTNVQFTGPARVIVTTDGVPIRARQYKPKSVARSSGEDASLMPGADNGLDGHRSLIGGEAAQDMDEDTFLDNFEAAMKANALSVVHRAREQAERYQERAAGGSLSQQEVARMRATAEQAAELQKEHDAIPDLTKQIFMMQLGSRHSWTISDHELKMYSEQREYDKQREEVLSKQRQVIARYPMLARVLGDIEEFARLDEAEQLKELGGEAMSVMKDIDDTRENIIDGSLDLWIHQNVVESTIAGLGITDETRRQWALDKSQSEKNWDLAGKIAITVFSLGFGIGAAFFTGGLSLALAGGAFGLSTADAIMQTEQYMVDSAAGNTNLDPEKSIVPPDLAGDWGWLVVAWVGVALDAVDAVKIYDAVGTIKAGATIDEGIEFLAKNDEALKKKLRVAAGPDLTPDDLVTLENKDIISRQLGAKVEMDDALGKEIRVHYEVDASGQVGVTRVTLGSQASALEALAHAEVVRLLERYRGAQGKLRELWDRMLSFVGKKSSKRNPFPPGTQAYESWLELQKLPSIIEARRVKLGTEIDKSKEALLRRDVEFLEGELAHHQKVVDQITLEKGVGFVAVADDSTKKAVQWGLPDLNDNPMITDPAKYYYRKAADPNANPPYVLVRVSAADAPPRSVVSKGDKWVIAEGGMTRTERAEALLKSWDESVSEGFETLKRDFPDAYKVVPLQGVAATDIRLVDLLDSAVEDEILAILTRAAKNAGEADPTAAAKMQRAALLQHNVTVVKGTDQLRAYNYRANFGGAIPEKDLHHVIPLYLGGEHKLLANVNEVDHRRLHEIFEQEVKLPDGSTLAPHHMRDASRYTFDKGAAVLHGDGSITLVKLTGNDSYEVLKAATNADK